ncbi:MAG: sulfatase family protein [Candidatus Sumerlaeaceae bacterium]
MIHPLAASVFAMVAFASSAILSAQETSSSASRPNIILILADDLDFADISIHGGTKTPTPNIDSIAKNGVQFTQAYVTCPVCGPSRVAILTGKYQDRIGYVTNHGPKIPANFGLPSSEVLVAEVLKNAGYRTGIIGKWHLGFESDMVPNAQGFDYFFGHLHGAHDYHPGVEQPGPILRNTEPVKTTKWLTTTLADEAARFISDSAGKPYFLYVPFNAVHDPLQAPEELLKKFGHIRNQRDRIMAAMLYELDEGVGKILQAVKSSGAETNTLVVFFNDNGGTRGHLPEANGELRGGKATLYEGGIRVPLFMQWPGRIPAGTRYEHAVISLDVMPTLLAAANTRTSVTLEGVNLFPYIDKQAQGKPHKSMFWRFVDAPDQKAARKNDMKIVQPAPCKPWELYDLAADPGETKNLATQTPARVNELAADWREWNSTNKDPLFLDERVIRRREELKHQDSGTSASAPPAPRQ